MTTATAIQVKNVKTLRGSTPEGQPWSCSIYFHGRRIGDAVYDGWGGPLRLSFKTAEDGAKARNYAAGLPGWTSEIDGSVIPYDLDVLLSEKVDRCLEERYLRKAVKTKVLARHVGQPAGQFHEMRFRWTVEQSERIRSVVSEQMKEHGLELEEILNERFA